MKHNKGFTLIEIIVVISIITIILGVSGLSLAPLFNTRLEDYSSKIGNMLTEARFKHISQASSYSVGIIYNSPNGDYSVNLYQDGTIINTFKIEKNYTISFKKNSSSETKMIKNISGEKVIITFKGNGGVKDNAGIIYITKNSGTKTMQIAINELTGKVVVSDKQ